MKFSRRVFLIVLSISAISVAIYRLFRGASEPENLLTSVLPAFLDTLIPADQTPSASQLNVDEDVIDYLAEKSRYKNIVMFGCIWLNEQANKIFSDDFDKIETQEKIEIVQRLEAAKENQTAQFFFHHIKDKAFEFYYSKPQSWIGLGISQPPQPMGYSDYQQQPQYTS